MGGAIVGEIFFDGLSEGLWSSLNRGKSFDEVIAAENSANKD